MPREYVSHGDGGSTKGASKGHTRSITTTSTPIAQGKPPQSPGSGTHTSSTPIFLRLLFPFLQPPEAPPPPHLISRVAARRPPCLNSVTQRPLVSVPFPGKCFVLFKCPHTNRPRPQAILSDGSASRLGFGEVDGRQGERPTNSAALSAVLLFSLRNALSLPDPLPQPPLRWGRRAWFHSLPSPPPHFGCPAPGVMNSTISFS